MATLTDDEIARLRTLADAHLHSRGLPSTGDALGCGASAAVFKISTPAGSRALKVHSPEYFQGPRGASEGRRLKLQERLVGHSCPNLIGLHSVVFDGTTCFIEMDLLHGPDLDSVIPTLPRAAIHPLISQLVEAVRFLESHELVHRDIKPKNIKLSADLQRLVLLDLGVVRELEHDEGPDATIQGPRKPFVATAQYSSPEYLFWLHAPSPDLWRALSIYQVGAVLHDMLTRRPLFAEEVATENRYALAAAVLHKIPSTDVVDAPKWLCALATRCLTKSLERRLAAVKWTDFAQTSQRTAATIARFNRGTLIGTEPFDDAIARQERAINRAQLMDRILRQLGEQLRSDLKGVPLETRSTNRGRVLTLRLPKTSILLDFQFEILWSELTPQDSGSISAAAQLRPDSAPFTERDSTYAICDVSAHASEAAVNCLFAAFVTYLDEALNAAELNRGALTEIQFLRSDS